MNKIFKLSAHLIVVAILTIGSLGLTNMAQASERSSSYKECVKSAKVASKLTVSEAKQKVKDLKKAGADKDAIKLATKNLKDVTKAAKKSEKLAKKNCKTYSGHMTKNVSAKVNVVVFAEFQCPACSAFNGPFKELREFYKDKDVNFIFRHFPIETIHPNARIAAEASEAASEQGKFWEMYDLLLQKQNDWAALSNPTDTFVNYASGLGLDAAKFRTSLFSHKFKSYIDSDIKAGNKLSVNAVPTIFVNGEKLPITYLPSVIDLKTAIDAALSK